MSTTFLSLENLSYRVIINVNAAKNKMILHLRKGFSSSNHTGSLSLWNNSCFEAFKGSYHLISPLFMVVLIICSASFLAAASFNFSCSASFSALFLSSSICLQFSSCAFTNNLTKLSSVDTTRERKRIKSPKKLNQTTKHNI